MLALRNQGYAMGELNLFLKLGLLVKLQIH